MVLYFSIFLINVTYEIMWLVRNRSGNLRAFYSKELRKLENAGMWMQRRRGRAFIELKPQSYPEVQWGDSEPTWRRWVWPEDVDSYYGHIY